MSARPWRILLVYSASSENATFSYQQAWPRHFAAHPSFAVTALNLAGSNAATRMVASLAIRRWRGDAIVLLHSVFSNEQKLTGRLLDSLARRREPKVFFIGNEYKLMPEKMRFCEALGVGLLISQATAPSVHALYRRRLGCAVAAVPNTGLDRALFFPTAPADQRPIDIGYRAQRSPWYLGHAEREEIADYFRGRAVERDLVVDISLDPSARFDERGWAKFLNRCRAQLGTEAGGDYFELTDRTRCAVNAFMAQQPDSTFREVRERFFDGYRDAVPLRIMSGRQVEAAGTRTVQVLFEGHYDGYLRPDEHYIPLKKDFSDFDEVMRKLGDRTLCAQLADNAYRLVTAELTYERLLDRFAEILATVALPSAVA